MNTDGEARSLKSNDFKDVTETCDVEPDIQEEN